MNEDVVNYYTEETAKQKKCIWKNEFCKASECMGWVYTNNPILEDYGRCGCVQLIGTEKYR